MKTYSFFGKTALITAKIILLLSHPELGRQNS